MLWGTHGKQGNAQAKIGDVLAETYPGALKYLRILSCNPDYVQFSRNSPLLGEHNLQNCTLNPKP